jgi:hypothetical protein
MLRTLTIITVAVVLLSTSAKANLIVNGSFEVLPNTLGNGSWTTYNSIPGWTASYGSIEVRNNVEGVAQDGNIFVELDAYYNSSMYSQTVATNVGELYTLSYYYAPRQNVALESNPIELYFNNTLVDYYTSYSNSNNSWVQRVFTVTGTGSDVISFKAVGKDDSYGGSIDNVSLVASVPEPSVAILIGFGLFSLLGFRRKVTK